MLGHSRALTTLSLAVLVTLALGSCASPTPTAAPGPSASHQELASHHAPVIRQGAITNQDYITAVDFDGDWAGSNNGCCFANFGDFTLEYVYNPYLTDRTGGGVSRRYTVVLRAWRNQ